MKNILILLFVLSLTSCYQYAEQTTPTLSGEYVIDKITVLNNESLGSPNDSIYLPGDVYLDTTSNFPMDSIELGVTRWHFDYSAVAFCPSPTPWGQYIWSEKYFYDLMSSWSIYDPGYVEIKIPGRRIIFKIIDDGLESLTFRTTGQWYYDDSNLTEKTVTLEMTRIGP